MMNEHVRFRQLLDMSALGIITAVIGGKVSAVVMLTSPEELRWFLAHPGEIFKFWTSGFSFYGVAAGGVGAGVWYGLRHDMPILRMGDLGIFWLVLGHAIQNMGDFLGGNHPGSPTDLPWGVTFTHWASRAPRGIPLHPFLLYIVSFCLISLIISRAWHRAQNMKGERFFLSGIFYPAFRLLRLKFIDGEQAVLAAVVYAFARFFAEFTRGPQTQIFYPSWPLPQSQMACIFLFLLSCGMYWIVRSIRETGERGDPYRGWMVFCLRIVEMLKWVSKRVPWRASEDKRWGRHL